MMNDNESKDFMPQTMTMKLEGDLVASRGTELREQLKNAIAQGAKTVVLDFENVRMVDSAGLGMLIAAHNSLRKQQGELAVTQCTADVLELFRSMRIHQHMKIAGRESVEE